MNLCQLLLATAAIAVIAGAIAAMHWPERRDRRTKHNVQDE